MYIVPAYEFALWIMAKILQRSGFLIVADLHIVLIKVLQKLSKNIKIWLNGEKIYEKHPWNFLATYVCTSCEKKTCEIL